METRDLADLDGRRGTGESGQACLERRHLTPRAAAARVDGGHSELVGHAGLQLDLLLASVVHFIHVHHIDVLVMTRKENGQSHTNIPAGDLTCCQIYLESQHGDYWRGSTTIY